MSETGEISDTIEAVKPKILYHASENKNVDLFKPRKIKSRDPKEGPLVFSTPDFAFATMFLIRSDDSWTKKGRFGGVYYQVISDRKRFEKMDNGGSIYTLPSDTFETKEGVGMGTKEWTSEVGVEPIGKKDYKSGVDAMLENDVQVFFVDKETFGKIDNSDDHGNSIIRGLKSENQSRNINPEEIPPLTK